MAVRPFNDPPWLPVTDQVESAHIDKAMEEGLELLKSLCRINMQGIRGEDPADGKSNIKSLFEEYTDWMATMDMLFDHYGLIEPLDVRRYNGKREGLRQWHQSLRELQTSTKSEDGHDKPARQGP